MKYQTLELDKISNPTDGEFILICIGNQMISSEFFKGYKKLHKPVGRVQFVAFEKFASAYLFQIAREKSLDYLLIIYKWQFLSRFSTWQMKATSYFNFIG